MGESNCNLKRREESEREERKQQMQKLKIERQGRWDQNEQEQLLKVKKEKCLKNRIEGAIEWKGREQELPD